jgi:hypothetical protein
MNVLPSPLAHGKGPPCVVGQDGGLERAVRGARGDAQGVLCCVVLCCVVETLMWLVFRARWRCAVTGMAL